MITINTERETIRQQMQEAWYVQREKEQLVQQLQDQLRQPVAWLELTEKRIIITAEVAAKIAIVAKELLDYLTQNPAINGEQVDGTTYIYVNFILPEHEAILNTLGATIETLPEVI